MLGDRRNRVLAALADGGAASWSSARLCAVCPRIVGVDGAGVMLMSGDIPGGSLCTTNTVSHLIEELQYTLGEGPCVDAYQHDQVVSEPDLADPGPRGGRPLRRPRSRRGSGPFTGFRCGWATFASVR